MRLLHTLCRFFVVLIAVRERAQGLLYVYAERSDLVRGATDFAFTYSRGIHTCRRTRSLSPPSLKSRVFRFDKQNLNYHPCRRNIPAVQAPAVNQKGDCSAGELLQVTRVGGRETDASVTYRECPALPPILAWNSWCQLRGFLRARECAGQKNRTCVECQRAVGRLFPPARKKNPQRGGHRDL